RRQSRVQSPRDLAITAAGKELRCLANERIPFIDQQLDRWGPAMTVTIDRHRPRQLDGGNRPHASGHPDDNATTRDFRLMATMTKPARAIWSSAATNSRRVMP